MSAPGPARSSDGAFFTSRTDRRNMSDELEAAVKTFLDDVDTAYGEYEQGYADADATLSLVMSHVEDLRDEYEG